MIKRITHFFKTIGVKYLSEGIITKLYDAGYVTVPEIISGDSEDMEQIEGLGRRMISKIKKEIQTKLDSVTLHVLMAASLEFGRGMGTRKLRKIIQKYPNLMSQKDKSVLELEADILQVEGFSTILAQQFSQNLKEFKKFFKELNEVHDLNHLTKKIKTKKSGGKLQGMSIVITGFRDKKLEEAIQNAGGDVKSSVSKNTTIVVYAPGSEDNSKYIKAKTLGIRMMTREQFQKELD